jgi:glucoamylase
MDLRMSDLTRLAPGWPGLPARWTTSAKSGVGTSLNGSRVWFTLSHGIIDEVYFGRVDWACTRDLGLLVSDTAGFVSEEKRHTRQEVKMAAPGVPAYLLTNTCRESRYRVHKEIITDPARAVVLQRVRFEPLQGELADYHLFVLLAPHLGNRGADNTAWVGGCKGTPMLVAERAGTALALASSAPWLALSAGFAGASDGWREIMDSGRLQHTYERAENGNVALIGEIDLVGCGGQFTLALGFAGRPNEAGHLARASLLDGFDTAYTTYTQEWSAWQAGLLRLEDPSERDRHQYQLSAAVLRIHQDKEFAGGTIASLSIPWGDSYGDDDAGGYHLVWARDLVEAAGGLLACGAAGDAARVLRYLQVTQEPDGHWAQNMWLDGTPYWTGIQMDETAFPILLAELAWREGMIDRQALSSFWPMVRRAAGFLACNGPVTGQDRWEEDAGYSPFTLAVEVAGILAAADLAEQVGELAPATFLREIADYWNDNIERWTYVTGTELARQAGVGGYYVRITPPAQGLEVDDDVSVLVRNRPPGQECVPSSQLVSPDALALVRFGLRAADDPRIRDTVKVIDSLLKLDTRSGPLWHRYNDDGYGEHADGSAFDGSGIGRAWPLLTGERAHYELAAGRKEEALSLLKSLESFANDGGMLPEQVWDMPDIPARELFFGQASGSAMPLVWAHAEHVKLLRSLREDRVWDMPPQPVHRYLEKKTTGKYTMWRSNQRIRTMPSGKSLRIALSAPAVVHWSLDNWVHTQDSATHNSTLGLHLADLPTDKLTVDQSVRFTFFWPEAGTWEGSDYAVSVAKS